MKIKNLNSFPNDISYYIKIYIYLNILLKHIDRTFGGLCTLASDLYYYESVFTTNESTTIGSFILNNRLSNLKNLLLGIGILHLEKRGNAYFYKKYSKPPRIRFIKYHMNRLEQYLCDKTYTITVYSKEDEKYITSNHMTFNETLKFISNIKPSEREKLKINQVFI